MGEKGARLFQGVALNTLDNQYKQTGQTIVA